MSELEHIDRMTLKIQVPIDKYRPLPVIYEEQFYDNWCWAACGTMYINYILKVNGFSMKVVECEFAKKHEMLQHVDDDLCIPKNSKFDIPLSYKKIRSTIRSGFDIATGFQHKIYFKERTHHRASLNKTINHDKRPVIASLERFPNSKGGHLVLIYGIDIIRDDLFIFDPTKGKGAITINYNIFAKDYFNNNGKWRYSWT